MLVKTETLLDYENSVMPKECNAFHTKISITNIENKINNILEKYKDLLKYYINISDNYWGVSFNVGMEQIQEMIDSMFCIYLYKDVSNNAIILLSKEVNDYPQWNSVRGDLISL